MKERMKSGIIQWVKENFSNANRQLSRLSAKMSRYQKFLIKLYYSRQMSLALSIMKIVCEQCWNEFSCEGSNHF